MAWPAAFGLLMVAATVGCGNQYKPVITPVQPTGPAGQPIAYAIVASQTGYDQLAAPTNNPCIVPSGSSAATTAATSYANTGVVSVLDSAGDSIVAQALIGNGPLTLGLDPTGGLAYTTNCDGTISYIPASSSLQTKNIETSTLLNPPGAAASYAIPSNILALSGTIFAVEKGHNAVAEMTGAPPALVQEIPVAPSFINMTGVQGAQRIYAISQGNSGGGTQPAWGDCSNPSAVTTNGEADGLDLILGGTSTAPTIANQSVSSRIPVGVCPVYGVMTSNGLRTFIMNRGSGTVTVINSQQNTLDTTNNGYLTGNGTITLPCPAGTTGSCTPGPVFADLYNNGQIMAVANYDDNTVSIIDIGIDIFGNDSPTFGHVLATIPVGTHPAALTILQDGSRVYVADQGTTTSGAYNNDGGVTIVDLKSFSVEKSIPIAANPRMIASVYNNPEGKVFVGAPNSAFVTVVRTDTDVLDASIEVQGNVVDLRTSTQYAGLSASPLGNNAEVESRSPGSGAP